MEIGLTWALSDPEGPRADEQILIMRRCFRRIILSNGSGLAWVGKFMGVLRWLDRNIEKLVIFVCYLTMAGIVFVEVIRRFVFSQQAAWSTTIPIYLFLWVTWFGASYNVRIRSHLSFDEIRSRLPKAAQFALRSLDAILWLIFGAIVLRYTVQQVSLSHQNFMIVQGTDNVMQWWFYLATPLAWTLLMVRVIQNFAEDLGAYRSGQPFSTSASTIKEG